MKDKELKKMDNISNEKTKPNGSGGYLEPFYIENCLVDQIVNMLTILLQLHDYPKLHVNKYGDILSILINKYKTHVNLDYYWTFLLSKSFTLQAMDRTGFEHSIRQTIESVILLCYD